jgi:endonuclease/exonuclease/phosphatase family metal-dependent hydrolase
VRATVVTWNLKGSGNPDVGAIVDRLRATGADVVALQEVQWHQARAIARALEARSLHWGFKHWPVRTWPEGMAVIGVTRPATARTRALSHRWRLWSWRRRIQQVATLQRDDRTTATTATTAVTDAAPGSGTDRDAATLVNVHLTPHGQVELRAIEIATVLAVVADRTGPVVVCGDLNERPGGDVHARLEAATMRDAWALVHDDQSAPSPGSPRPPDRGATNWRGWTPGTDRAPAQRLDYVYVSPSVGVRDARVPHPDDDDFAGFSWLSDHLPVTAELDLR